MRKLILYIATSMDGYIAKLDGDTEWLHNVDNKGYQGDYGYDEFIETIDTTIMGHNTYKTILGFGIPFPYPEKKNYVFSKSALNKNTQYVTFINEHIIDFVSKLKNQEGKDIWLIGGGQINSLLVNHNILDEIILSICPVMLGAGIRLFEGETISTNLHLIKTLEFESGFVQMHYQVLKSPK